MAVRQPLQCRAGFQPCQLTAQEPSSPHLHLRWPLCQRPSATGRAVGHQARSGLVQSEEQLTDTSSRTHSKHLLTRSGSREPLHSQLCSSGAVLGDTPEELLTTH